MEQDSAVPLNQTRIWQIPVANSAARATSLEASLDSIEQQRARAYLSGSARLEFVTGRAVLRRLLARALGVRPGEVGFSVGELGKPALAAPHDSRLTFSLSHSAGWVLCALGWNRDLGIDLQRHVARRDHMAIARWACSPEELRELEGRTGQEQIASFYTCWCRKEAVLKALGVGLSFPVQSLDVLSQPGTAIFHGEAASLARGPWHVRDLETQPGHSAAIAIRGQDAVLMRSTWDWSLE